MPPTSRGWPFLGSIRHASMMIPRLRKPKKFKTSPIEGRAAPSPDPKFRSRPDPKRPEAEPVLPRMPSRYERLRDRIPLAYRRSIARILIIIPFGWMVCLHFPWTVYWTTGISMAPLLNQKSLSGEEPETKEKVLVKSLLFPRASSTSNSDADPDVITGFGIRRGQVVVFKHPLNPARIAVKRIVGVPGDRVQPLPGYIGGSEPVVVGYNQIWVEGDVDDRSKSRDSNWYGPISANLILGEVVALLEPVWNPTWIRSDEHKYPAKLKGRVKENVVRDAMMEPDEVDRSQAFADGRVRRDLDMITQDLDGVVTMIQNSPEQRKKAVGYYKGANAELARDDPRTKELAGELAAAVEDALVMAGFARDDLRNAVQNSTDPEAKFKKAELAKEEAPLPPPVPKVESLALAMNEEPEKIEKQQPLDEGPAARALREHLEKRWKEKEQGIPNGLDDSERQMMWREQDRTMRENVERIKAQAEVKKNESS